MKTVKTTDGDTYMSPKVAIVRMSSVVKANGSKEASTNTIFQQERECWVAGVFLFGYSQITGTNWWLKPNPDKKEAPDIYAVSFRNPITDAGEIGAVQEQMFLEICEFEDHSKGSLVEHINEKLKNKAYDEHTRLICYAYKTNYADSIGNIIDQLKSTNLPVLEVWLLFHPKELPNFTITRVFLKNDSNPYLTYSGNFTSLQQVDFVQPSRGSTKKVEFSHLGQAYWPLPRLDNK